MSANARVALMTRGVHGRPVGLLMFLLASLLACGSNVDAPADGGLDSGNGGSAGNGGAGGAAGTGSDANTCGCVTDYMGWAMDGGLTAYQDTSGLHPCDSFVFQRIGWGDAGPTFCEQPLAGCAGTIGAGDVARAVAHADVQAAIALGNVLYGEDTRPVDGQVLRIEFSNAVIEVGLPCRTTACTPIPPGVDALATLLPALTQQELARPPCRTTFPPP